MRRAPAFAAILVTLALGSTAWAGQADFQLLNRTGYQIDKVYVSPPSSRHWGPDLMGTYALVDGTAVNVHFPEGSAACRFDLKVTYNDGDTSEWGNMDLCHTRTLALRWDGQATRAVSQ